MTWPEIRAAARAGAVAVVPTGSLEQHGPHLPVKTDTALVSAVAEAALSQLPPGVVAILAPTLWLGASHHHLPFFALSVAEQTYVEVVLDLAASLADAGFSRVFFLNGHGGNAAPLRVALSALHRRVPGLLTAAAEYWTLAAEGIRAQRTTLPGGAAHAGEVETSLLLHLEPEAVRQIALSPTVPPLPAPFTRDLVDGGAVTLGIGWEALSADGTLGDPGAASAEKGHHFFQVAATRAAEVIAALATLDPAALRGGRPWSEDTAPPPGNG